MDAGDKTQWGRHLMRHRLVNILLGVKMSDEGDTAPIDPASVAIFSSRCDARENAPCDRGDWSLTFFCDDAKSSRNLLISALEAVMIFSCSATVSFSLASARW